MRKRLLSTNQLLRLVRQRRMDAEVLFENKRYNGSVYMAGYAVECALKATVCRLLGEEKMPLVLATHDLDVLVGRTARAGLPAIVLWKRMAKDGKMAREFARLSEPWSSELRYETSDIDRQTAKEVLNAATLVTDWLNREFPGL